MPYRWLFKPLILLALIGYYIYQRKSAWKSSDSLITSAFVFAWLGDVLLLWEDLFLYGLGAFMLMQILYTVLFLLRRGATSTKHLLYAISLVLWTVVVLRLLWPYLNEMKIPVITYTAAIGLMALVASIRKKSIPGYWIIVVGTILFMISDSALAIGLFSDINPGKLTVMSTYAAAQYLIMMGFLDQQHHLDKAVIDTKA